MRESHFDEQMVQMQPVGAEGRHSVNHSGRHHPECIENWNGQNRQCERNQPHAFRHQHGAGGVGGQNRHHKQRHNGAQKQGAAIADEHLRLAAEHVVEEERYERSLGSHGDYHHRLITKRIEHYCEHRAGHRAKTRRVAIDAIDEVDGVHYAHRRKHRERNGQIIGYRMVAPKTKEIVYLDVSEVDNEQHGSYLQNKPHGGRKVAGVVDGAHAEHCGHRNNINRHIVAVGQEKLPKKRHHQNANKHRHAAQNGHRNTLQLASVGVIDNAVLDSEIQHSAVDYPRGDKRYNKRYDDARCHLQIPFTASKLLFSTLLAIYSSTKDGHRPFLLAGCPSRRKLCVSGSEVFRCRAS